MDKAGGGNENYHANILIESDVNVTETPEKNYLAKMSSLIEAKQDRTITENFEFLERTNKCAKRLNEFRKLSLVEPIFILLVASSSIFSAGSTNFPLEKVC